MDDSPTLPATAADHLRVIRSLMERSTAYQAISAGPALFAGLLAAGLGTVLATLPEPPGPRAFALSWLAALIAVAGFNTWTLRREAQRRGAGFPSPATLHGLRMLAPPMLACGLSGLALAWFQADPARGALLWTIGYGLALLATASFAPASIRRLGWAFVAAGLGWFLWREGARAPESPLGGTREAAWVMALAFGGIHLAYAACEAVSRRRRS